MLHGSRRKPSFLRPSYVFRPIFWQMQTRRGDSSHPERRKPNGAGQPMARQYSPGRGSTYRHGVAVQTAGQALCGTAILVCYSVIVRRRTVCGGAVVLKLWSRQSCLLLLPTGLPVFLGLDRCQEGRQLGDRHVTSPCGSWLARTVFGRCPRRLCIDRFGDAPQGMLL
jgi:hypothetical protein